MTSDGCTPRARVLLVEDDRNAVSSISIYLARQGFEVLQAASGDEAESLVRRRGPPDVLLTDWWILGKSSGVQLARRLQARDPGLRVVFMTSRSRSELRSRARGVSFVRILAKPTSLAKILEALEEALSRE